MAIESEKPSKRTTNPGVRVIGGRIYDSSNGKTCHQCRQKTMDFVASCKYLNKEKLCPINFCHKCLINRYGEKAEDVAKINDWICPKCRGNCNCSLCRKKRGLNPTGILAPIAKANGLTSVSELLEVKGSDKFGYKKRPKLDDASIEGSNGNNESVSVIDVEVADVAKEKKKVVEKSKKAKATNKLKEEIKFEAQLPQDVAKEKKKMVAKSKKAKATNKLKEEIEIKAQLPQGISLTCVSGVDIPTEEAGNVCQFLEFCLAFGKVFGLMEGQAESVVCELFVCRRNTRRQQYCSIVKLMIQLLDLISKDREMSLSLSETDSSWFTALGEILLHSEVSSDEFPPQTFELGVAEYEKMDASKRLKLLNFICDESLSTWAMRDYIKSKSDECKAKESEAKQKAVAAKEKEKQLKQKMQCDLAKAMMEKYKAPLSIEEHNLIMSQIRAEAKEAHDEMMEAKGIITSGKMPICDAVRTEPILKDDKGVLLWKLKCYEEEPNFLLQDLGTCDDLCPHEKWLAFKPEHKLEIEQYITFKRMKLMQTQKNANVEAS